MSLHLTFSPECNEQKAIIWTKVAQFIDAHMYMRHAASMI